MKKNLILNLLGLMIISLLVATINPIAGLLLFGLGFVPKGMGHVSGALFAELPDVSAITTSFGKWGGEILKKSMNELSIAMKNFYRLYPGVNTPIILPKFSYAGEPRPYSAADATGSNDLDVTDRTLTVRLSKWDMDFDYEKWHNTYLASNEERPYEAVMLEHLANGFKAEINDDVVWLGNYNSAGTTAVEIADGWGTIIADEITALNITPIATGAITSANAVSKLEVMKAALPAWARGRNDVEAIMSYATFDNYMTNYRDTFTYLFMPRQDGFYYLDGTNIKIRPESFMGSSGRVVFTVPQNLVWGMKGNGVKVHASQRRNIVELRMMLPVGFQIADLQKLFVNDQA